MKLRITTVLLAGIMGMTALLAGCCCPMHRHDCDKPVGCDKCDKTKTAPQEPKAEQK